MINEYYKNKLSKNCQVLYKQMLQSFQSMQMSVEFKTFFNQDIINTYVAIYNDHPELFYLSYAPQCAKKIGFTGNNVTLISNSIFTRGEIFQYRCSIDKILKNLENLQSNNNDDFSIEKMICDYMLQNITYEINNVYNQNAATVLVKKKGQCSGIAKAVKLICDYFDIECFVVNGTANDLSTCTSGPHSWNIVNINGKYYHLDVTFMMGANVSKQKPFNYLYLNYSDNQIATNHQWEKNKFPKCDSTMNINPIYHSSSNIPGTSQNTTSAYNQSLTISSYAEFRREIGKKYDNREKSFSFLSNIQEQDSQKLLNALLTEATNEAKGRNIGFSINITIQGKFVAVDLVWK